MLAVEGGAAAERETAVESILRAFGLTRAGSVSGAAYGGRFDEGAAGEAIDSFDPTTGEVLASVRTASAREVELMVRGAQQAFERLRQVPAPSRGE